MIVSTWLGWLLHSAVGGAAILLLVWLLMKLARQPARRQRLGEWGVLVAVLVPAFALLPSWLDVPLPASWAANEPEPENSASPNAVPADPVLSRETPAPEAMDAFFEPDVPQAPTLEPAVAATPPAVVELPGSVAPMIQTPPDPPAAAREREPANWLGALSAALPLLVVSYVGLVALFVLRWLFGCLTLRRLIRNAEPAPAEVGQLFAAMTGHLQRQPRLLVSSRLPVPISCGIWRPTVILSPDLCRPGARAQLRWVFAHELTHLERRDSWSCHLFSLAQALYFFLPWFWWLRRHVRLCQEFVADSAACEAGAAEDYAQFLLNLRHARALPVRAVGVSGNPSDLYRRVTMLLQSPVRVERRCPRWWSLMAATGLLGIAVAVGGLGLKAQANPVIGESEKKDEKQDPARAEAPKEEPKVADPLKPADFAKEVRKLIKEVDPATNPEEFQKRLLELQKRLQPGVRAKVQFVPGAGGFAPPAVPAPPAPNAAVWGRLGIRDSGGRLGISGSAPSAVLVEQLDLPAGKGLVINQVTADSAAAKAGLKVNDVLLKLNGKDVPNNLGELGNIVDQIKANTPFDAVVLRKGKKETIKGISLPEAKPVIIQPRVPAPMIMNPIIGQPGARVMINPNQNIAFAQPMGQQNGVMTSIFRTDDRFTTRHQEGSLIITVTGKVETGKPMVNFITKVKEITVQDGAVSNKYESLEKVPEQYRDKVKNLIEMSEKSSVKIEIKR
jgi:beta-lactamase regulating signal transducer with metallopeptidase domain